MEKVRFPHPAHFRVPEPRARTQGRYGAGPKKSRVGQTEGFPTREALQRCLDLRDQVGFRDHQLQRPLLDHEEDQSRVLCKQQGIHRREPGNVLEEYPRSEASQNEHARGIRGDRRNR